MNLAGELDRMKESFLWAAAKGGRVEEVDSLLNIGANVDWVSPNEGETPLMAACRHGHREVAALLLAHGSDPANKVSGESALHASCRMGDEVLSRMLIDAGADGDDGGQNSAFGAGRACGHAEMVARLRRLSSAHRQAERTSKREETMQDYPLRTTRSSSSSGADQPPRLLAPLSPPPPRPLSPDGDGDDDEQRRSSKLLSELASTRADLEAARAKLRQHQGHDLHTLTLDDLATLAEGLNRAAQRVATRRESLLAAKSSSAGGPVVLSDALVCSITRDIFHDPVICSDGHTYERHAIEHWLVAHDTSPKTGVQLESKHLVPNYAIRSAIDEFKRLSLNHAKETPASPPLAAASS